MELEAENWRLCGTTLVRCSTTLVRRAPGELEDEEDENWRLCSATLARGVSGELEDENWRLGSATFVRGVSGSWKMRTGDLVVQL